MASIKFYLKNKNEELTSLFMRVNYGAFELVEGKKRYRPLKYYINESIEPKFWNIKEGRAFKRNSFPQHPEFNTRLENIENDVLNIIRRLQNDNIELTEATIREEIDKLLNKGEQIEKTAPIELMEFINNFITNCNRSEGTKKSYRRVEKDLNEFKYKTLTFKDITLDFHSKLLSFYQKKNYSPNTIGTRIKVIKTFMNEAYERDLHTNLDFRKKAFDKPSEETKAIYLNKQELSTIKELDLSNNKTLDNVRDWFLIGANTGLRVSDLQKLTKEHIQGDYIIIRTQKTTQDVIIPISKDLEDIFIKHNYNLPKFISEQKFNNYIKDVAKLAKLDDDILIEQKKGIEKVRKTIPKYECISAHTARRSFATNLYLEDIPTISIMKLTGHKTEASFLKYIKLSKEENAKKLQSYAFFQKTTK